MLKLKPPPGIHVHLGNFPQTTTILALGFLFGVLFYTPMLAWFGTKVPEEFRDEVAKNGQLFRDGMLLILGFYFAKVVNAGQQEMANKAIDAAANNKGIDSGG